VSELIAEQLARFQLDPRYSQHVTDYLVQFGYIDGEVNDYQLLEAIKQAQEFMAVKVDGLVGPKTLSAMYYPRCGCRDIDFLVEEGKLGQKHWKYYVSAKLPTLTLEETKYGISRGLQNWSDICDVHFEEIDSKSEADAIVGVATGSRNNFDGPGKTLAWCELAQENYRQQLLMFDGDETWVLDPNKKGILVINVLAHEAGHLLGMSHSKVDSALMAPFYSAALSKPQRNDDISRIQKIYGPPKQQPPQPQPQPPTNPTPPTQGVLQISIKYEGTIKDVDIPGYRTLKLAG
jgi:matrix metalloproteinase-14 (membrane-inserted)